MPEFFKPDITRHDMFGGTTFPIEPLLNDFGRQTGFKSSLDGKDWHMFFFTAEKIITKYYLVREFSEDGNSMFENFSFQFERNNLQVQLEVSLIIENEPVFTFRVYTEIDYENKIIIIKGCTLNDQNNSFLASYNSNNTVEISTSNPNGFNHRSTFVTDSQYSFEYTNLGFTDKTTNLPVSVKFRLGPNSFGNLATRIANVTLKKKFTLDECKLTMRDIQEFFDTADEINPYFSIYFKNN